MKRTGVIVGVGLHTDETLTEIAATMERAFPGIVFAVVCGSTSVVFEFDDGKPEPSEPF